MRLGPVLATLLCFITWMSLVDATHGPEKNCCPKLSTTRVKLILIKNYTIQSEGSCPFSAVAFETKGGKTICSDPKSKWAKNVIRMVDAATKALPEMEQSETTSTSALTTAVSTKSTKKPGKKARRMRRRQMRREISRCRNIPKESQDK